jgi:predicted ester cyclase
MSEKNKAIYLDHFEVIWNAKQGDQLERFIAPRYQGFDVEEVISGIEGYKQHFLALSTAFPDVVITIHAILADQDLVSARYLVEATHRGDFAGIPPTGHRVRVTAQSVARIEGGLIVEEHSNPDSLGLLRQLGVISPSIKAAPLIF